MGRVLSADRPDQLKVTTAKPARPSRRAAIAAALGTRRRRLVATVIALAYLLVYLWAIRHLIVTSGRAAAFVDIPSVRVVPDWPSRVFDQAATFNYEPVVAIYPIERVQLLLSPVNTAMGLLLGALVSVNILLADVAQRAGRSCRRGTAGGVLGSLPGLLTGFACCVPTFALVLGTQATALLIGLRSWLFPAAAAVVLVTLWWSAGRTARVLPAGPPVGH
ncbi:MAG: hypothetical protein H0U28_09515 [Nocardioidaceae bacterium]|nr:hypothetical protein [Nocardioidaceae bacterium]